MKSTLFMLFNALGSQNRPAQWLLPPLSPNSPNLLVFEPNKNIASTTTTFHPDGSKTFRVSIDTSSIQSAGLFYNVLAHELGHVADRRDMSGGIMDFTVIKNQKGQLFQHSPYHKTNFRYPYYAHLNGSGILINKWV